MQNNMHLPANGGPNTSSKRKRTPATQQKWTLLNLLETWFLCDGVPVIVDPTAGRGASNDEWRKLVRSTGVRISDEQLVQHWGQMARRDFLNWCENVLPEEKRPKLFDSYEAAVAWRDREISNDYATVSEPSKRIEISEDDEPPLEAS